MAEDAFHGPEWRKYSRTFRRRILPKLANSEMFLSIQASIDDFDLRQATEIGAALILGKPLLIVVPRGRSVPDGLRRAADAIVENWDPHDPDAMERVTDTIKLMPGMGDEDVIAFNADQRTEEESDG